MASRPKGSTESRPPENTAKEEFLFFYSSPALSDNDIAFYFRLCRLFGERLDFAVILESEKKNFDDFPNLLEAVRNFHAKAGKQQEKTHRKGHEEIRRITENEKILYSRADDEEKNLLKKILNKFGGRLLQGSRRVPGNGKGYQAS